jgi:PAS domain S-box-containing protein
MEIKVGVVTEDEGFRLLFAGSPLPKWFCDLETLAFLDVNHAALALYGYSRGEFLRMRLTDIRFEEDADRLQADVHQLRGATTWSSGERRHRLRDGRLIDVQVTAQRLTFHGRPAALVVVHDLTARKEAERRLKRSEARNAAIVESALDCIITMDAKGLVVEFNPAAERTFGYRRNDAVGRPLADLIIPPALRQAHRDGLALYHATGEATVLNRRIEMTALRADGTEFPVELTISVTQGEADEALYTGFVRDISERKRAEDEWQRLNTELEERVRRRTSQLQAAMNELEAFSYSVSHDLRAPLRSIDGFSHALAEDAGTLLPAEAARHLDRIRAATQRMGTLVDDLLRLSKASRGELKRETIDVSDLAHRIATELGRQEPTRPVTFDIAPALVAQGDARLLRVALENLLDNAWKFTRHRTNARIEVGRTSPDEATAAFFVRDNGAGFDPTYAEKLFGPFQRLHTASEFPGNGIGLATVRRIVHRHGGRVWAEGEPDRGACFYFTLS